MNEKKMRKINSRVDEILVDWLKTLVSPKEAGEISINNISSLMPDQNYYEKDSGIRLTTFSKKNIKKELKSLVSKGIDINTITWEDFNGR